MVADGDKGVSWGSSSVISLLLLRNPHVSWRNDTEEDTDTSSELVAEVSALDVGSSSQSLGSFRSVIALGFPCKMCARRSARLSSLTRRTPPF